MQQDKNTAQAYISLFAENRATLEASSGKEVNAQRQAAFDFLSKAGFPSKKNEDYRYTDLNAFFQSDYGLDLDGRTANKSALDNFSCSVPSIDAHVFYLINGWFYAENKIEHLPQGVIVCSLAEASQKYPGHFKKYYNALAQKSSDSAVHFNTMLAQDGLFLYVPCGIKMDKPLQIVNVLSAKVDLLSTQRSLFIIENDAQAKVLVCDHALSTQGFAANHVREVFVEESAAFEYYLIENQHNKVNQLISSFIRQEANSKVHSSVITLHNGRTRNNMQLILNGENAHSELYGMALTDKQQHVDNFTEINHAAPHCTSKELFKNVLDDSSTGAFKGRVLVQKEAQKTEAYQTNKNICLTPQAYINTRPQLEIYADDVKCSHGATVGQLDEEALFYMQARGIGKEEARMLLMFAFTHEVIEQVNLEPLRERLKFLVEKRLRGEMSKCEGCAMCG